MSLLLLGLFPVFAQSNQTNQKPSPTDEATTVIQVATAARGYAEQLVTIANQHQVNVTGAVSLIAKGDPLLAQAQGEVSTNATLAINDAMGAMSYFKAAAQDAQSAIASAYAGSNGQKGDQIALLKEAVGRATERVGELQAALTKACPPQNSTSACTDAQTNLAAAKADLDNATSLLNSSQHNVDAIVAVLKDAQQHMSAVYADINKIAGDQRAAKAIAYIQDTLQKRLANLTNEVSKLDPSVASQYKPLLDQAQALLTSAIQSFQSGDFGAGMMDAKQAVQLMEQVAHSLQGVKYAQYVQTVLQGRLNNLTAIAQKANLNATASAHVQSQLTQAQSLLDGAVRSFLSGDIKTGSQQVQQATQLMQQIYQEITNGGREP